MPISLVQTAVPGAPTRALMPASSANCSVAADANTVHTDVSSNPSRCSFKNNLGQAAVGWYRFEFVT